MMQTPECKGKQISSLTTSAYRNLILLITLLTPIMSMAQTQSALVYKATLNGVNEIPPTNTGGYGSATVRVAATTKQVDWNITYGNLTGSVISAHIHCGADARSNSGVAVKFGDGSLSAPITGSGTMTESQLAELAAGRCYVNLHTAANKGGEVRGQLLSANPQRPDKKGGDQLNFPKGEDCTFGFKNGNPLYSCR